MPRPRVPGYIVGEKLGSGSFADVYKAHKIPPAASSEAVAVKCILKGKLSTSFVDSIVTEIKLLKSLKHPNIVEMIDFLWDDLYIYIIMEYCGGGDLSTFIRSRQRLRESTCKVFLEQLASALSYLRQNNVAHMDLKPQNLLLTSKTCPVLKLTDFGLAQSMSNHAKETSLRGSPLYMAPEILLKKSYDASVDLWSVGVILYECLFGKAPYSSKNLAELVDKIKNAAPIVIPTNVELSSDCRDLLAKLLQRNPKDRITFEQFFNHPFAKKTSDKHGDASKARKLIQQAKDCDTQENISEAFVLYCEALSLLMPLHQHETDTSKRSEMESQVHMCVDRAEQLKKLLACNVPSNSRRAPVKTQNSLDAGHSQSPATPFDELRRLSSATPHLKVAIDIGIEAVQYDAEGQYSAAFDRYEMALQKILELLNAEPKGRRKELLYQQATLWIGRAEELKKLMASNEIPSSTEVDIFDDARQCSIQ